MSSAKLRGGVTSKAEQGGRATSEAGQVVGATSKAETGGVVTSEVEQRDGVILIASP